MLSHLSSDLSFAQYKKPVVVLVDRTHRGDSARTCSHRGCVRWSIERIEVTASASSRGVISVP
jgi:hypothetical protein